MESTGTIRVKQDIADRRAADERGASAPARTASESANPALFLWPPLILAIVLLWFVPMGTSLGLDESGNWWVVKDGIGQMFERARFWPGGQSILFNFLVIGARAIGGDSDIAMRVPALLAALGTLPVLYRLGVRLANPLAGMFACLAFVSMGEVIYVASVLRPYSLAILFVTAAMLMLVRWMDNGSWKYGVAYAVLASLTLYATVLYGTMFLVHAIYAMTRIRKRDSAIGFKNLASAWIGCGLMLLPLVRMVAGSLSNRARETYLGVPSAAEVLASVVPPLLAAAILLGILTAVAMKRPIRWESAARSGSFWMPVLWGVTPPLILLLLSLFTDIRLFAPRYFLANAPGIALAAGLAFSAIAPFGIGRLIAGCVVLAAILNLGVGEHFQRGLHDFRGAVQMVRDFGTTPDTPVLVVGSFIESQSIENLRNPEMFDVMFSAESRYRMPGHLIGLPIILSDEAQAYLEEIYSTTLKNSPRFVFFGPLSAEFYRTWLMGRSKEAGFVIRSQAASGGLGVVLFERGSPR